MHVSKDLRSLLNVWHAWLFDPLGLIFPFTITAKNLFKNLFQDLWRQCLEWDVPVHQKVINHLSPYCTGVESVAGVVTKRKRLPPVLILSK